jgi:hypothetical protein
MRFLGEKTDSTPPAKEVWACKCGRRNFNHHEFCGGCGEFKPAPEPVKKSTP